LDDAVLLGQDALLVNETPVELGSAPEDQIPLTAVPGRPPPASSAGAAATPVPSVATTPQPSAVAKPQPVVSVPAAVGGKKDEKSDKSTEAAKTDPAPSKAPAVSSAGANSSAASSPSKASTPQPKSTGPPPPSGYAPTKEKCGRLPSLVRSTAKGRQTVSQQERDYLRRRRTKASRALRQWLRGVQRDEGQRFRVPATAPTLALTVSGGGLRSMLVGAGVVQALDEDDSNGPVSGLYQAMSYHAGLSGGAWLLASIVGNGFDRISGVAKNPWATSLLENNTLILTDNLKLMPERKAIVANDVSAKARAGFRPTPADPWGRASGYVTLRGKDGGAYQRLSDVRKSEKFRDHDVPYPIITALGMEDINGKLCDAVPTEGDYATQYEFSPHEFGSWQKGVEGFIPTELLGTAGVDGKPKDDVCVKNFDNLGFVIGISSMRFNEDCGHAGAGLLLLPPLNEIMQPEYRADPDKVDARRQLYAPIPNPFKSYSASPKVSKYDELYLFDGGQCKFPFVTRIHSHGLKSKPKQPHLAADPARPPGRRHLRQRQLGRHGRRVDRRGQGPAVQLAQRHRAAAHVPHGQAVRPDQDALHPGRRHLHAPGARQAGQRLRLPRPQPDHHRLPSQRPVQRHDAGQPVHGQDGLQRHRAGGHDCVRAADRDAEQRRRLAAVSSLHHHP
jgi:hypothetical protein